MFSMNLWDYRDGKHNDAHFRPVRSSSNLQRLINNQTDSLCQIHVFFNLTTANKIHGNRGV